MKKAVLCITICFLNLQAKSIDYTDFPPNLRQILDQRINDLASRGRICIADKVAMSDGFHIRGGNDTLVNFYHGVDDHRADKQL